MTNKEMIFFSFLSLLPVRCVNIIFFFNVADSLNKIDIDFLVALRNDLYFYTEFVLTEWRFWIWEIGEGWNLLDATESTIFWFFFQENWWSTFETLQIKEKQRIKTWNGAEE